MIPAPHTPALPDIKGFNKNTLLDWEGEIASIIFLPGCNFRCPYCHASALVKDPGSQPSIPLAEIDGYLADNRGWVDGVIITGGEPTLQPGLPALIDRLLHSGVRVKLFTNGTNPDMLAIAMDVKAPLDERYERAAGVPLCAPADRPGGAGSPAALDAIRRSIEVVMNSGLEYEFRTTICPAVLSFDDVVDTARCIEGARRLVLQQFRPVDCLDPAFEKVKPYPPALLQRMAEAAETFVQRCTVTG